MQVPLLRMRHPLRNIRQSFVANGNEIKVIYADSPDSIDYTAYGIDNAIVIVNTGVWRTE